MIEGIAQWVEEAKNDKRVTCDQNNGAIFVFRSLRWWVQRGLTRRVQRGLTRRERVRFVCEIIGSAK